MIDGGFMAKEGANSATDAAPEPIGERTQLTRAMPKDTNPSGDIFGGWLMSQMDMAGAVTAEWRSRGRVATIAVQGMVFHRPVHVGDLVSCYADLQKVGTTSMTVLVETWVLSWRGGEEKTKVTEGVFTYVAIDDDGRPRAVPAES